MSDPVEPQPPTRAVSAGPTSMARDVARRRRARLVRFIALLAVLLLAANLVVLATGAADDDGDDDLSLDFTGDDDRVEDRTDEREGTTTSVPSGIVDVPGTSATTVPGEEAGGGDAPAGDDGTGAGSTTTSSEPPETTTTTAVDDCLDRNDPACGPFRYEPEPGPNAPLAISISVVPASPMVGEMAIITVVFTDTDAVPVTNCGGFDTGEGIPIQDDCAVPVCPERFGPTSPPVPQGGTRTVTIPHVYEQPGTYSITASGQSSSVFCDHPYGSSAVSRVPVSVAAAP